MATKQGLYRAAMLICKQNAIGVTVSDDQQFVNTLNLVYDDVLAWALEQGAWNHATRTAAIEASEDVEPEFGFSSAVPKPDDYAGRIVAISADERFHCPLVDYHEEGGLEGFIYCDVDPLYLRYVSNGVSYGLNLAAWPFTYTRFVEHELAFRIAPQCTSMGEESLDRMEKRKIRCLREARTKDVMNQAPERRPEGRLVRARRGNFGRLRERSGY